MHPKLDFPWCYHLFRTLYREKCWNVGGQVSECLREMGKQDDRGPEGGVDNCCGCVLRKTPKLAL